MIADPHGFVPYVNIHIHALSTARRKQLRKVQTTAGFDTQAAWALTLADNT